MTYIEENSKIWDERSENNDIWSMPVSSEMVNRARKGVWSIVLTPTKPVPASWFPDKLEEKKIHVITLASSALSETISLSQRPYSSLFFGHAAWGILVP